MKDIAGSITNQLKLYLAFEEKLAKANQIFENEKINKAIYKGLDELRKLVQELQVRGDTMNEAKYIAEYDKLLTQLK